MPDSDPTQTPPESAKDVGTLRRSLRLPTVESSPTENSPWSDDLLGRQHLATNLTEFVRPQRDPLVISLHGEWGSGKTFFLRRWVQQLRNERFPTFYYNAWSDDYSSTPIVSILSALEDVRPNARAAAHSLRAAATSFLLSAPVNLLKAQTGVDLAALGLDPKSLSDKDTLFDAYRTHRSHQRIMRTELTRLSSFLSGDSSLPTICVIDELDRCRPTFAIELLETVKHVFDIPGLVFLLALNRSQLPHSIRSVYGNIDADAYLRRFFHVHLNLPVADTEPYSAHLLRRFHLDTFFPQLSELSQNSIHRDEYRELASFLPGFFRLLRLHLREIEYFVTTVAIVARNLPERHFLFPFLLTPLVALRLRDGALYRRFASGSATVGEVVDSLHDWTTQPEPADAPFSALDHMEATLYIAQRGPVGDAPSSSVRELRALADGDEWHQPTTLSRRTVASGADRAKALLRYHAYMTEVAARRGTYLHTVPLVPILERLDLATPPSEQ